MQLLWLWTCLVYICSEEFCCCPDTFKAITEQFGANYKISGENENVNQGLLVKAFQHVVALTMMGLHQGGIIKFASWELATFSKYFARVSVIYRV